MIATPLSLGTGVLVGVAGSNAWGIAAAWRRLKACRAAQHVLRQLARAHYTGGTITW